MENYTPSFHQYNFRQMLCFPFKPFFQKEINQINPSFYKEILLNWKTFFSKTPETPSSVLSQFLWYNIYVQIDKGDVHLSRFSQNNLNFVSQLFDRNGSIIVWHFLKQGYQLNDNSNFQWLQLIKSITEK